MKLTNEANALYRKLNERRRLMAAWRDNARYAGAMDQVQGWQRRLIKLDRICDKALSRLFRREDQGL